MIELHPHGMAHGGEAVARRDGKAHFIAGAMPGEVVRARVVDDRGNWARAELVEVIAAAADRRTPPCPHASSCGGCQWQFAPEERQREWKRETVASQLAHLGRIADPLVHGTIAPCPPFGYRNRMDFHVLDGAPALMRARTNELVALTECPLLHPELAAVFARLGDLTGAERLTLRIGTRTGDMVAIVTGSVPDGAEAWGLPVVHNGPSGARAVIGEPRLTEVVDGVKFSIPVTGFFQNVTEGADALVSLVRAAADLRPDDTMLDGFCGVGLFGATVGADAAHVVGIDRGDDVVEHARRNLAGAGVSHRIIAGSFARDIEGLEAYWDVAVVDPPRTGLGANGVAAVTSAMPRRIVYVACDPASLARDCRSLTESGYAFVDATPVDMFPQTYHVEVVATFDRVDDEG